MSARVGPRIETRLDEEHQRQLADILEKRGWTISAFVRKAIEDEEQRLRHEEFVEALEWIKANPIDLPPWEVLKEELNARYDHLYPDLFPPS
ncbi:MAG: hypothetical protein C0506_13630 [Anaerolinea sp.]|nr:hypothetical protein [Anaerolinea sp.]